MSLASHLIDILLPSGGYVVALFDVFLDESGAFDTKEGILCIAGYVLHSEAAKAMDAEWASVLKDYKIPYFHMVDCAHGAGIFEKLPKERRAQLVKELIALIKKNTIGGFAVMVRKGMFNLQGADPYSFLAQVCLFAATARIKVELLQGDVAYFF